MKATTLLKRDHSDVKKLFRAYRALAGKDAQKRAAVYAQIASDLKVHMQIEEEIVYPAAMRMDVKGAKGEVFEALEEHALVKSLLGQLDKMHPDDESYEAKVTVVMELVEHHVEEEEDTMFPNLERALPPEHLGALGAALQERKLALKGKVQNGFHAPERLHAP